MNAFKYIPIIKTTDAEIKGYRYLSDEVKKDTLPLFELTRSRPVKGFPTGDIHRRMGQLREYTKGNPFILDLTKHEDLANDQIEALIDDTNGFHEWRHFLSRYRDMNIIPMLHLYPDAIDTFLEFVRLTGQDYERFAFRVGLETSPAELSLYMKELSSCLDIKSRLILIVDADFVDENNIDDKKELALSLVNTALDFSIGHISLNSSSFPFSVLKRKGSRDDEGVMDMLELALFSYISSQIADDDPVKYGDYAGVHPIRYTIGGGNWVPRIDQTLQTQYIYKRFRRHDGGYIKAAKKLVEWNEYFSDLDCWGVDQIIKASNEKPEGKSPSFWISVRLNQHITRLSMMYSEL